MTSSLNGFGGLRGPTGQIGNKTPSGIKVGQLAQFTPEQQQLFQQLFSNVGPESYLARLAGGDQALFNEIEAPALRQFNELQGGLASRFSAGGGGRGALSSRHSSAFQNAARQQSSNFAQELQAQRQGLQRQAIQDLQGLSRDLLSYRPYQQFTYEKPKKSWTDWLGLAGAGLGAVGGSFFGNPLGGAQLGYGIGSAFSNPTGGQGLNFTPSGEFGSFRNPFY